MFDCNRFELIVDELDSDREVMGCYECYGRDD